jgi:preprotein translocase SecF subunit
MMKNASLWLKISAATILVSVILIIGIGPVWGIDFVGGSLLEARADAEAIEDIRTLFADEFDLSATIQTTLDGSLIIRTTVIDETTHQAIVSTLKEQNLIQEELRFEAIGPTIGQELRRKSIIAISLVIAVMIAYLAYTFRDMKGLIAPWKFGLAAVYALVHDLLLVTALFVLFGRLWDVPLDTLFVTAQLAILGYSVNDTIVLFHRVKTEWLADRKQNLGTITDRAIKAVLSRSLNTSFTTLLVLTALLVFGGSTIRWFIVALAAGTVTGTYSSLLVAPPLLQYLAKRRA